MTDEKLRSRKIASRTLLICVFFLSAMQVVSYYQVRYQLASPLIPEDTVDLVSIPHLYSAMFLAFWGLLALAIAAKRKFIAVIVICATAILLNQIAHQYALFSTISS